MSLHSAVPALAESKRSQVDGRRIGRAQETRAEDVYQAKVREFFRNSDIEINGGREWDIQVGDERLYRRMVLSGSLGLGEAYMDGWWECDQLEEFFSRILRQDVQRERERRLPLAWATIAAMLMNLQSRARARQVAVQHYDIDTDVYEAMLDESLTYTCAYWRRAANLSEAQQDKLDLVCRKLDLHAGERVLDIGCGWGSFARYASEAYGATVVGITISGEQVKVAQERCRGLPVQIRLQDYRDCVAPQEFDKIVSLGMAEHVGFRNYRRYFSKIHECLKPGGLALVQVIGTAKSTWSTDPWINKYIFPNSMLPSVAQIGRAVDSLFHLEDWQAFGKDYERTLLAWYENFEAGWPALRGKYGDRFHRMWRYYLLLCAGIFRARAAQLWQVVLSKDGLPDNYVGAR